MAAAVAFSRHPVTATAAGEVVGQLMESLPERPDLAVLLATPGHAGALEDVARVVEELLAPAALVGAVSSAPATAADPPPPGRLPALACLAATLDSPLALVGPGDGPPPWRAVGALHLSDVSAAPPPPWLTCPVAGGATDATGVLVGRHLGRGAVTVLAGTGARLELVSAAGVRSFGPRVEVTRTSGDMVVELDGRPAHDVLVGVVADHLAAADLPLVGQGLLLEVDERQGLEVRGVDRSSRALAVAGELEVGAAVRFAVRDPSLASSTLGEALAELGPSAGVLAWHAPSLRLPDDVRAGVLATPSPVRARSSAAVVAAVLGGR